MVVWKGNNKECVNGVIEGEPVKLFKENDNLSFIFMGYPYIEYFKSKIIKCHIKDCPYSTNQINLN